MKEGIQSLRDFGFQVDGFVYPCNKHGHFELLKDHNIKIIRGENQDWKLDSNPVQSPLGFWVSPAFISFKEMRALVEHAVEHKSFIHPWMHLVECEPSKGDLSDFYRPLFELILELKMAQKLEILSFSEIYQRIKK